MSDELKSALDLAMEKLDRETGPRPQPLTDDQKVKIADIRSRYSAKTAELEIATEAKVRKALQSGDHETAEQAQRILSAEKQRFEQAQEKEIKKVRSGS
jgi:vacuolar-type H+-ATPase subunit H